MREASTETIAEYKAVIIPHEVVLVLGIQRTEFIHLQINDSLHVASLKGVSRNLFRESW